MGKGIICGRRNDKLSFLSLCSQSIRGGPPRMRLANELPQDSASQQPDRYTPTQQAKSTQQIPTLSPHCLAQHAKSTLQIPSLSPNSLAEQSKSTQQKSHSFTVYSYLSIAQQAESLQNPTLSTQPSMLKRKIIFIYTHQPSVAYYCRPHNSCVMCSSAK